MSIYFSPTRISQWSDVIQHVGDWLSILKREYLAPDLWEISERDKKIITNKVEDLENKPFDSDELKRISKGIYEIRDYLSRSLPDYKQNQTFIETRLAHLEDASKRLGRKDWTILAMGILSNLVIGAAMAPENAQELIRNAGALLGWVWGNIPLIS